MSSCARVTLPTNRSSVHPPAIYQGTGTASKTSASSLTESRDQLRGSRFKSIRSARRPRYRADYHYVWDAPNVACFRAALEVRRGLKEHVDHISD